MRRAALVLLIGGLLAGVLALAAHGVVGCEVAARAVTTPTYHYDELATTAGGDAQLAGTSTRIGRVRADAASSAVGHRYDDRSSFARTNARLAGERSAPNTAAGLGDDVLALPRGGARLSQDRLDHIILRHWDGSQTAGAGHFAPGTTGRNLTGMIDDTVRGGSFRPNTNNRPGTIFEQDFGSTIGTNVGGSGTSRLRVVVDPNGNVITAFPY